MLVFKKPEADLRSKYRRTFEIALIFSLVLLIAAFKYSPHKEKTEAVVEGKQEIFTVEDIQRTNQETKPPPPPKPPIPIEAPSDDVLEDIEIASTEIDLEENVEAPPLLKNEKRVVEDDTIFVAVENMPKPIGGIAGIQSKIVYPEFAKRAGVEGRVYVLAFVDENGDVMKVNILKGIGAGCDEAAMAAVQKTKFEPGKQRGKAVKVQVSIPVIFKLN